MLSVTAYATRPFILSFACLLLCCGIGQDGGHGWLAMLLTLRSFILPDKLDLTGQDCLFGLCVVYFPLDTRSAFWPPAASSNSACSCFCRTSHHALRLLRVIADLLGVALVYSQHWQGSWAVEKPNRVDRRPESELPCNHNWPMFLAWSPAAVC